MHLENMTTNIYMAILICPYINNFILLNMHVNVNRVKGTHARLKKLLPQNMGDFCNCWDAMPNVIVLQHTKIKVSFQNKHHCIGT